MSSEQTSDTFRIPFDLLDATKHRGLLDYRNDVSHTTNSPGKVKLLVSQSTCRVPRHAGFLTEQNVK